MSSGIQQTKGAAKVELQTKIPEQEELLTVDEVRVWLRLGRTRVNELLQSGEIPSFKVGRRRFIRRGDVTATVTRSNGERISENSIPARNSVSKARAPNR